MFKRLVFTIGIALGLQSPVLASNDLAATLLQTSGSGRIVLPGGANGDFKAGTMLAPGSRILTDEGSQAVLILEDGSRINLGPNTDLTVAQLKKDGDQQTTVFQLLKGLFKASVQKLTVGSRFEVHSNDAVAAVKGTEYEVEVTDEGTDVRVDEGKVWLEDVKRENRVEIGARHAARAERRGRLGSVREMSKQERENFGRWVKESFGGRHSGAYLPVDKAKRAAWNRLRPEQRYRVGKDLADSMGKEFWNDVLGLRAEERQERWRDRLRDSDERHLAAEGSKVDFALGKSVIDRQGRRVRFDEYVLRPAANKVQFLNYSKRDNRLDTLSSINTYNKALPRNLSEAKGINQRLWLQSYANAPQYWVTDQALVGGNSFGDSFATSTSYYDPYYRVIGVWELPVRDVDVRLNIPDLNQPRVGGTQVEHWVRQDNSAIASAANSPLTGVDRTLLAVALRSAPGSTNNIPNSNTINDSNLVWALGGNATLPTTTLIDLKGLEAKPGDVAFGFRRTYANGMTMEFRNYVIDENGQIVNLAGVSPDKLMETFINRKLIASLSQIELRSNQYKADDGINIVSKLLFLHDITKTQDQL